jgi:ferrous iron transport protein A
MNTLDVMVPGTKGVVTDLDGRQSFISRAVSIGFTPGVDFTVLRNFRHWPVVVWLRDTQVVIDRDEAKRIIVDERK